MSFPVLRFATRLPLLAASLVAGLLIMWPLASPVAAHANLIAASPAAGQPAGGTIDRVQLIFDKPISELVVRIEGPDGTDIDTTVESVSPQQFDLAFDPLSVEGIYRVRYEFLSIDDDRVELGHAFEFDRSAPAPLPLTGPVLVARSTSSWWQWVAVAVLFAVVVALAERLRRRRRALARLAG